MMVISGDELQTFKLFTKSSKWVLVCVFISENRRGLISRHTLQMAWDPLFIGILEGLTRYRVGFYTVPSSNWHVPELFCLLRELATVPCKSLHGTVFSFWHVLNSFCLMCELAMVPCKSLHGTVLVFWICLFLGLGARCRVFMGTVPCSFVLLVFSSVFLQLFACFFVWGLVLPEITF